MRRPQLRRRRFGLGGNVTARRACDRQVIDQRQRVGPADRGFVFERSERSGAARQELDLAIAQRTEAVEQAGERRDARCQPQLDLHAGDTRALHQAQQLCIVRFERGNQARAFDFDLERPIAELHGDEGLFLFVQLAEHGRQLIDQALLGARVVQRIEARLANESLGDELHQRLLDVEHAMTQGDLVAAALETGALAARIFQHREDRLVQLQVQMQHARRRGFEAARGKRRVDQTRHTAHRFR